MVVVRFKIGTSLYNPGEVAGFDRITASELVKRGVAEFVESQKPSQAKKATKQLKPNASKKKYVTKKK